MNRARVDLGQVLMTSTAQRRLCGPDIFAALQRHATGDWGDVEEEDRCANERALRTGARLLSVYHDRAGETFWIITEADRSSTTVLLPEDY